MVSFIWGEDNDGNQSEIGLGGNIGLTADGTIYIGSQDGTTVNGGLTADDVTVTGDLMISNGLTGGFEAKINVLEELQGASSTANAAHTLATETRNTADIAKRTAINAEITANSNASDIEHNYDLIEANTAAINAIEAPTS